MAPVAEEDIDYNLQLRDDIITGLNSTSESMLRAIEVIDLGAVALFYHVRKTPQTRP